MSDTPRRYQPRWDPEAWLKSFAHLAQYGGDYRLDGPRDCMTLCTMGPYGAVPHGPRWTRIFLGDDVLLAEGEGAPEDILIKAAMNLARIE